MKLAPVGFRTNRNDRCPRCQLKDFLCLCAELPRVATRTRVDFLLHPKEWARTSNTGKIAHLCLSNSSLNICDRQREEPWAGFPDLPSGDATPYVFFPTEDARPADAEFLRTVRSDAPLRLVVIDGAWKQAGRMLRHVPQLWALPRLRLPSPLPADLLEVAKSEYRLRKGGDVPGRLSTLEAVAKILALLEGDAEIEAKLLRVQRILSSRTLLARGKIPLEQAALECELPTVKLHELKLRFAGLHSSLDSTSLSSDENRERANEFYL